MYDVNTWKYGCIYVLKEIYILNSGVFYKFWKEKTHLCKQQSDMKTEELIPHLVKRYFENTMDVSKLSFIFNFVADVEGTK